VKDDLDESKQRSEKHVCFVFNYALMGGSLKWNAMTKRSVDMAEISFIQFLL